MKKNIVFGFLGLTRDRTVHTDSPINEELGQWRPTLSIFSHPEFPVHYFHLIFPLNSEEFAMPRLAWEVLDEIRSISPDTILQSHVMDMNNPWDLREVYQWLWDMCENLRFTPEKENYYFHITVGTHVQQICVFLLTELRRFPGKVLQTYGPSMHRKNDKPGYVIMDPHDLPVFIREHRRQEKPDNTAILKSGFASVNPAYNMLIDDLRRAAEGSREPILLLGETGTGKSVEARRIYEVKKNEFHFTGKFIEINCATITKDLAIAMLFGYKKGDYSGAVRDQAGILQQSDGGMLFLDEIGEFSLEVQAMLLQAIETRHFKIFGIHEEIETRFQLVCGTNRDLERNIWQGLFREDLHARINFWSFTMPPLRNRQDDIPSLVEYYLKEWSEENGDAMVTFENNAHKEYLDFAMNRTALWTKNLRELNHSVKKMCYYANSASGIINAGIVRKETEELRNAWGKSRRHHGKQEREIVGSHNKSPVPEVLLPDLHSADRLILERILHLCASGASLGEAGKALFARESVKKEKNYSDLARKFLDKCSSSIPGSRFILVRGEGLRFERPDFSLYVAPQ
jgi:transcriptional regulatory protein RtcR